MVLTNFTSMPKLSIITINYNNASGLRKTIESVISQTSHDYEYLVIDGGSTDGSMDVIKEFSNNITYWVSVPDNGIYNAMNKGIKAAKGEYCQFLNSGDILASLGVTEKMLICMPNDGIVLGNMLKKLPNGKIHRDKGPGFQKPTFLTFYRGTINHSAAYIKRSLFYKYGMYDENLHIVSDWKWYLFVVGLNNESVSYINTDLTLFEMSGISNSNLELDKLERQKVLDELIPANILADYNLHWQNIDQVSRIKRYIIPRFIFWLMERSLFKWEKNNQKFKNDI